MPDWDWGQFVGFVLATGLISTIVTAGLNYFFNWRAVQRVERQKRRYLALRIAVQLENYASVCSDAASEASAYYSSGGHQGSGSYHIEEAPTFPPDPDAWLALQPDLANRCLSMANEIESSRSLLRSVADNLFGPDEEIEILAHYEPRVLKHGMAAWELAADLRRKNDLKPYTSEFDTFGWMKERFGRLEEKRIEREKRQVENNRQVMEAINTAGTPASPPAASKRQQTAMPP